MKYYFVGMHNKPNTKPLCSSTKTGKIIDIIASKLLFKSIKTNFCDTDYLPTDLLDILYERRMWYHRNKPGKNDVIILLGKWVDENFLKEYGIHKCNVVSIRHPASIYKNKSEYIDDCVRNIQLATKK